jgi:hypothetical protein
LAAEDDIGCAVVYSPARIQRTQDELGSDDDQKIRKDGANRMKMFDDAGYACSICAPSDRTKEEVETFATLAHDKARYGRFEAVDIDRIPEEFRRGNASKTPHPCPRDGGRTHWFLLGYR